MPIAAIASNIGPASVTVIIQALFRRSYFATRTGTSCFTVLGLIASNSLSQFKIGMQESARKVTKNIGFLTVRHHEMHGFFGGYLIVNELARPLEFHCTLPILPTRAQQILYGNTLNEFVCGEQIARALVTKAKTIPDALLADSLAVLTLRHMHSVPIGFIDALQAGDSGLNRPASGRTEYRRFKALGHPMAVLPEYESDCGFFSNLFAQGKPPLDLLEPFGRIEEALQEAHPATKAA